MAHRRNQSPPISYNPTQPTGVTFLGGVAPRLRFAAVPPRAPLCGSSSHRSTYTHEAVDSRGNRPFQIGKTTGPRTGSETSSSSMASVAVAMLFEPLFLRFATLFDLGAHRAASDEGCRQRKSPLANSRVDCDLLCSLTKGENESESANFSALPFFPLHLCDGESRAL